MNFAVVNLGCKVNRVESDAAAAQLLAAGGRAVTEAEADLVVVNTCTVTGEAEKKTRKAVRRALRANGHARVVVTGCAAALDAAAYKALDARVRVVPKAGLAQALEALLAEGGAPDAPSSEHMPAPGAADPPSTPPAACAPDAWPAGALLRTGEGFPTRVGVKVQDGCDNACTYCIVHVARGRAVSRPADQVVAECVAYARAGVREIVLAGQGEPPCRFRISSIEPRDVDDALVDVLATAEGRVCRQVHLPLQAGSDAVLHAMARPYRCADYVALVDRLRAACPSLSLSTDVIVGFPGETGAQFEETLDVARRCGFAKIHVFPYSKRAGTPAAARSDQVPAQAKAARAATLRALSNELRAADFARRAGTTELALVEEGGVAMTESHYRIRAPRPALPGSLVPVVLEAELP